MGAVWLIFGAKLRLHWRSWLVLSLLIAVASGLVLAAAAAGRRTDSAFPRYVASHGYDAIVYSVQPLPGLARLPEVAQVTPVRMPWYGQPRCSCQHRIDEGVFSIREVPPRACAGWPSWSPAGCPTSRRPLRRWRRSRSSVTTACTGAR
jgi:hypothetical protein